MYYVFDTILIVFAKWFLFRGDEEINDVTFMAGVNLMVCNCFLVMLSLAVT